MRMASLHSIAFATAAMIRPPRQGGFPVPTNSSMITD
jgi:hypothetical protein